MNVHYLLSMQCLKGQLSRWNFVIVTLGKPNVKIVRNKTSRFIMCRHTCVLYSNDTLLYTGGVVLIAYTKKGEYIMVKVQTEGKQ
ncbi:hypothetical protein [Drosophila suzukii associated hytrosavirus 1]|nr:hypothetical protein [Drosophila suzukii associated hytrosavirus 1]